MDRYCEDCPTCPGKCLELKACVQCKQFKSGELHDQKVSFAGICMKIVWIAIGLNKLK
jgi:hypothetical protein